MCGGEPSWSTFWLQKPSILRRGAELVDVLVAETINPACMCVGGGRGGERGGRAFYYTYIYSGKMLCLLLQELLFVFVSERKNKRHHHQLCAGGEGDSEGHVL